KQRLFVGGGQRRIAGLERANERFHKDQVAADDLDGLRLCGQPQGFEQRAVERVLLDGVDDRARVEVHQTGCGQRQRSHASFSSRRCCSYSAHVLNARGPAGNVARNSSIDRRRGLDGSGKRTMTSTLTPSGSSGALTSSRCPGKIVVSNRNAER